MKVIATAHPNIALIKYWGKQHIDGSYTHNIPATPSLSVTLDQLTTTTELEFSQADHDQIKLNGQPTADEKILGWLAGLRAEFALPFLTISTSNNFPTASGLASSASGFAALIAGLNQLCDLQLSTAAQSGWARRGSASAARSLFPGWVQLTGPNWEAAPLAVTQEHPEPWALDVVIAITDLSPKGVSSSQGMRQSAASPFFDAWVSSTKADFTRAVAFIQARDFNGLAELAEHSCLKMHGLMLSTQPGLVYWQPATLAAIHCIRDLRRNGCPVFFTIDAGPQVKALCLPAATAEVRHALTALPGVQQVLATGLGAGAQAAVAAQSQ